MTTDDIYRGIQEYNTKISNWAYRVHSILKRKITSKATKGEGVLESKLRTEIRKDMGEVDMISYKFPRHGVFFQKGVGRGHVMQNGRVIRGIKTRKGIRLLDGPINRKPQDWFNSTMDKEMPVLADTIAEQQADAVALNARGGKI